MRAGEEGAPMMEEELGIGSLLKREDRVPQFLKKPRAAGREALRVVGQLTPLDRAELLDELGDVHEFAEPGSVSYQLMNHVFAMEPEAARAELERIFDQVAAPLYLRPLIPALIATIEERVVEGETWKISNDNLRIEVPLDGYALIFADKNAYTPVLLKGKYHQKVETAEAIVRDYKHIAHATETVLIQPEEGDAGFFMIFNAEQLVSVEAGLDNSHVPMRIERLKRERHRNGREKYPYNPTSGEHEFTQSVGVHTIDGPLSIVAYAGNGARRGGVVVTGEAAKKVVGLQKTAGAGEKLRVVNERPSVPNPAWNKKPEIPQSNLVAIKLIEALLQMSPYAPAALSALLKASEGGELRTAKMNASYLVLDLQSEETEKVDHFWRLLTHEGTGTPHIQVFKSAGAHGIHFWSQGISTPKEAEQAVTAFTTQMSRLAHVAGLDMHLSIGHEEALELIPLPDSFQVDATGPSIVATVRANFALEGKTGNWVSIDSSAVEALGLVGLEMITVYLKDEPYQMVQLQLDALGRWQLQDSLLGRETQKAQLHQFVDELGKNGVVMHVHKPFGAEDSGYGESALIRDAEVYAENSGARVHRLKNGDDLFASLEQSTGYSVEELMTTPKALTTLVLLVLDEEDLSPHVAARLDRFLVAMVGAPVGLIHTGAYRFRHEMFMGNEYQGRQLSKDLPVEALEEGAALELVFRARPDLKETDREVVAGLFKEWGRPLVPRLLIHNFARALVRNGVRLELQKHITKQVWAGQLAQRLEEAGLDEKDRTILGVIAEVGYPVPLEFIQGILGFDCREVLTRLSQPYLSRNGETVAPFLFFDGGAYVIRESNLRSARLLARKHQPAIHELLRRQNFLREDAIVTDATVDRSVLELEHALAHTDSCTLPRTLLLVTNLGKYYLKDKRDFGAAYGLYHRFLAACAGHGVELKRLPEDLLRDLVWALLETSHEADTRIAQGLLHAHQDLRSPELMWRGEMRLLRLLPSAELAPVPSSSPYSEVVVQIQNKSVVLDAAGIKMHHELIKDIQTLDLFSHTSGVVEGTQAEEEFLKVAFDAAALGRIACAARQFTRLAHAVKDKLPEEMDLLTLLRSTANEASLDAQQRLSGVELSMVGIEALSQVDKELKAEILRCLLGACKYLAPDPTDEDMIRINRYHRRADKSFAGLDRPVQSEALDSFDVAMNAAALHWQMKLPLPQAFPGETETTATSLDREGVWAQLSEREASISTHLKQAVREALLPLRHRLTHQLMNFLQLKMRLLARTYKNEDGAEFHALELQYKSLAADSARLYQVLFGSGSSEPDYYFHEVLPIRKAIDA